MLSTLDTQDKHDINLKQFLPSSMTTSRTSTTTVAALAPVEGRASTCGDSPELVANLGLFISSLMGSLGCGGMFQFKCKQTCCLIYLFSMQMFEHICRDSKLFSSLLTSVQPPNLTHFLEILSKKNLKNI